MKDLYDYLRLYGIPCFLRQEENDEWFIQVPHGDCSNSFIFYDLVNRGFVVKHNKKVEGRFTYGKQVLKHFEKKKDIMRGVL